MPAFARMYHPEFSWTSCHRLPLTLLSDALPLTVRALLAALRQLPPNSASHQKALEAVLTSVLDRCLGPASPPVT